MRLAALLALTCLLSSCAGLVGDTVRPAIRTGLDTLANEPPVEADLDRFLDHLIARLTHDLVAAVDGEVDGDDLTEGLRAVIHAAIDQLRIETADLSPRMEAAFDSLMLRAEAMVGRIVTRSLHDVRAMIHEDRIADWVSDLMHELLVETFALVSSELDDESAQHIGHWMHGVFGEIVADVEFRQGTHDLAQAAAQGIGDGLADSIDGRLGEVIGRERRQLAQDIADASATVHRWEEIAAGLVLTTLLFLFLYYRTHRAHQATIQAHEATLRQQQATIRELVLGAQRGADAATVLQSARERGVRLGEEYDGPGPPKS